MFSSNKNCVFLFLLSILFIFTLFFTGNPIHAATICLVGDANCDGNVDGIDFTIWLSHYNQTTTQGVADGDFNSDGKVDGIDFTAWLFNYGKVQSPTPRPTNTPTPTSVATYPAQVLNLTNWKETLPIGSSGSPTEIKQPQLATYKIDPWFIVNPIGSGVRFRVPVNGVTTSGSNYARSELREMTGSGTVNASWSSGSGIHTMIIDETVTALPQTKREMIVGQIHDASNFITGIRLVYPRLFIENQGTDGPTLDSNYTFGKRFTIKFEVSGNQIKYYYNGGLVYTRSASFSGGYFKVGAYVQSNCSTEGSSSLCSSNNYGEMILYNVTVNHQ